MPPLSVDAGSVYVLSAVKKRTRELAVLGQNFSLSRRDHHTLWKIAAHIEYRVNGKQH